MLPWVQAQVIQPLGGRKFEMCGDPLGTPQMASRNEMHMVGHDGAGMNAIACRAAGGGECAGDFQRLLSGKTHAWSFELKFGREANVAVVRNRRHRSMGVYPGGRSTKGE